MAKQDPLVPQVLTVSMVRLVPLVLQARMAKQDRLAPQVPMAKQDRLAPQVPMAKQDRLAPQVPMAKQDRLAPQVRMAKQDRLAPQVRMAKQDRLAPQVPTVQTGCLNTHIFTIWTRRLSHWKRIFYSAPMALSLVQLPTRREHQQLHSAVRATMQSGLMPQAWNLTNLRYSKTALPWLVPYMDQEPELSPTRAWSLSRLLLATR
jgi:hypothetical protein